MNVDSGQVLQAGARLADYRIIRLLGKGGFGLTYLAFDENLHKYVAIKEYLPAEYAIRVDGITVVPRTQASVDDFTWGLSSFINEARTLARFQHPNIVQVYRYFEVNGTAYIVMEYVEGRELREVVADIGQLDQSEVLGVILPIMDGLAEVHRARILHRDIAPDNIRIRDNGRPVLIDFGAARQAIGTRTRSITTIVKPGYAPVEQYNSAESDELGPWTDIYALAATAYYCLTLQRPLESTSRVLTDRLPRLSQVARDRGSLQFLRAIEQGLAIFPQERPQTLAGWAELLRADGSRLVRTISDRMHAAEAKRPMAAPKPEAPQSQTPSPALTPAVVDDPTLDLRADTRETRRERRASPPPWQIAAGVVAIVVVGVALNLFWPRATQQPVELPPGEERPQAEIARTPISSAATPETTIGEPPIAAAAAVTAVAEHPTAVASEFPVQLRTEPAAATVVLIGLGREYQPGMLLPPGRYPIEVLHSGYRPYQGLLEVVDREVNVEIRLEAGVPDEEAQEFADARARQRMADWETYLRRFPAGAYVTEARFELDQARQRWQDCNAAPGLSPPELGRALFYLGDTAASRISVVADGIEVPAERLRLLTADAPEAVHCWGQACLEVTAAFGYHDYEIDVDDRSLSRGGACFYYVDDTPHVYN